MVLKPIVSPVDVSEPFNIKTREFFLSGRPVFFSFIHSRCASNSLAGLLLSFGGCSLVLADRPAFGEAGSAFFVAGRPLFGEAGFADVGIAGEPVCSLAPAAG